MPTDSNFLSNFEWQTPWDEDDMLAASHVGRLYATVPLPVVVHTLPLWYAPPVTHSLLPLRHHCHGLSKCHSMHHHHHHSTSSFSSSFSISAAVAIRLAIFAKNSCRYHYLQTQLGQGRCSPQATNRSVPRHWLWVHWLDCQPASALNISECNNRMCAVQQQPAQWMDEWI